MPRGPKRVWFLVVPRTGIIDLAGPWEVLGHANEVLGRVAYELEALGPSAPSVRTRHGLVVSGLRPLPRAPARLPDVAIVAGAPVFPLPQEQASLVAWLRRHRARIPTLVSICTGAFVLGAAGVLDGRRATTHWQFLGELRARYPRTRVVRRGHLRQGRQRLDLGRDHVGHRHDARARRGGPRTRRRHAGRQAARAVPAPLGEPGAVQRRAPPAGDGAVQAPRRLRVRPRPRRRAAARRAPRGRRGHEPADARPLVPRAPRRIARRARAPPAPRRGASAARGDGAAAQGRHGARRARRREHDVARLHAPPRRHARGVPGALRRGGRSARNGPQGPRRKSKSQPSSACSTCSA
jgi:putative intracellular protease/amidase